MGCEVYSENQDYQTSLDIQCKEYENERNTLLAQQLHDEINGHEQDPMLVQHLAWLVDQLSQIQQIRDNSRQDRALAMHLSDMENEGIASGIMDQISSEDLEEKEPMENSAEVEVEMQEFLEVEPKKVELMEVEGIEHKPAYRWVEKKPAARKEFDCIICFDSFKMHCKSKNVDVEDGVALSCAHVYCVNCLRIWIQNTVESRKIPLMCASEGCSMVVCPEEISEYIDASLLLSFHQLVIEKELIANGMYCPIQQCSHLLAVPEPTVGQIVTYASCPSCDTMLCMQCKTLFHEGLTCEAYQALPDYEKKTEDLQLLQLAGQNHWKRCPNCSVMVSRTEGCNHIKCKWYVVWILLILHCILMILIIAGLTFAIAVV